MAGRQQRGESRPDRARCAVPDLSVGRDGRRGDPTGCRVSVGRAQCRAAGPAGPDPPARRGRGQGWRPAEPTPSLAPLLARAGIGFVVVRHDLDSIASSAVPQSLVRSTLEASPGFARAASLGPRIGEPGGRAWLVDGGAGGPRPAIEIYEVVGAPARVTLLNAEGTVRSNGSSDMLASLVDGGLPVTTPVLFGNDGQHLDLGATALTVATDGVRRQQDAFGGPFRRSPGRCRSTNRSREIGRCSTTLPAGVAALSTFRVHWRRRRGGIVVRRRHQDGVQRQPSVRPVVGTRRRSRLSVAAARHGAEPSASGSRFGSSNRSTFARSPLHSHPDGRPLPTSVEITTDDGSSTESVRPSAAARSELPCRRGRRRHFA